jgi:hypothetical protein
MHASSSDSLCIYEGDDIITSLIANKLFVTTDGYLLTAEDFSVVVEELNVSFIVNS